MCLFLAWNLTVLAETLSLIIQDFGPLYKTDRKKAPYRFIIGIDRQSIRQIRHKGYEAILLVKMGAF